MFTAYEGRDQVNARDQHLEIVWGSRSEQEQEILRITEADLPLANPGAVCYVNPVTGEAHLGAIEGSIPMWLYTSRGFGAGGVAGASGPAIGNNVTNMVGSNFLCGLSPRMLRTYEFDDTKTYPIDTPLTVILTGEKRGKLTPRTAATQILVGYVTAASNAAGVAGANDQKYYLETRFLRDRYVLQVRTAFSPMVASTGAVSLPIAMADVTGLDAAISAIDGRLDTLEA